MIVELRRYSLVPGGAAPYLRQWDESGRRPQVRHLGEPLGVHTVEVGTLNTLVFLWQYDDVADRERRRAALAADAHFAEFRRSVRGLLVAQHTEILTPHVTHTQRPASD